MWGAPLFQVVRAQLEKAAMTLLHLPLLTLGHWGDGTEPQSLLALTEQGHHTGAE